MSSPPADHISGKGSGYLGFEETDQRYHVKLRAFVKLCMPPVFDALEREYALNDLREDGIVPIMHYLEMESFPQAVAFNSHAECAFGVWLRRSVIPGPPGASKGAVERLNLDMQVDVSAPQGHGDPALLGAGSMGGPIVPAGRLRAVQVLTRPVAPAGERQVTTVPPQLSGLQEHPWDGPYPSVDNLRTVPEGYRELEAGPWQEQRSVWALHNTDINQHVNVHEYIFGMENHYARMLFGADLPVQRHRIDRAAILFRRPFFAGEPHGIRAHLHVEDHRTLLCGAFHRVEPEGGLHAKPSVFIRMSGELRPEG